MSDDFPAALRERFTDIFAAWARGWDVAPGKRARLEGYIEAGLRHGLATPDAVTAVYREAWQAAFDTPPPALALDETPLCLPLGMREAPVYRGSNPDVDS